ncbi:MAG: terminase [Firmicutes bacterium]|nr:terminase [Bacillota bacterium]
MDPITITLFQKIAKAAAPPPDIKPSEWAEQNLVINESGFAPGKWRSDSVPYQKEIIDAVVDPNIDKIIIKSSSQGGKNVIVNIIFGYYVDIDPCPILFIEPTVELAQDYSKRRLAPLIRDTPALKQKIHESKSRDSNNTIQLKMFPGGSLNLVGSNSPRVISSKPIKIVIADEIDGMLPTSEGDALELADRRTTTFPGNKTIYVSTPTKKESSRIEVEYNAGTQEKWEKECPHCKKPQYINWNGLKFDHVKDNQGNYSVSNVVYQCPDCLKSFGQSEWARQEGHWVAYNPGAERVRSFHWNAFVSPGWLWEDIVLKYLKVKGDPEQHMVFRNTVLGEVWEENINANEYAYLLDRREDYGADLPDGVLLLTAGVDTQDDRLEYEVVGWGRGEQSWGIEYGLVMGNPDQATTWQALSDKLDAIFYFASGAGLKIACTFIDSGGHYTSDVYNFCRANEHRKIFAIRGKGGAGIPLIYSKGRSKKENALYFNLGVDGGKARVLSRLQIKQPGDGYCHYPFDERRGYDQIYFKGLLSERQSTKKVGRQLKIVWEKIGSDRRNEPLDVRNYAQAAFQLLPINWDVIEKRLIESKNSEVNPAQKSKKQTQTSRVLKSGLSY